MFGELARLHGDKDVWKLVHSGRHPVRELAVDGCVPRWITWDDYRRLLESIALVTFASPDDVIRRFDEQNYLLDTGGVGNLSGGTLGRPAVVEVSPVLADNSRENPCGRVGYHAISCNAMKG